MRKVLVPLAFGAAFTVLTACGPQHPALHPSRALASAPSDAAYSQKVTADGYKLQKAGTIGQVTPALAKASKYFDGAAIGTKGGREEVVLEVSPKAGSVVKLAISQLSKRAEARGFTVVQSGNLVTIVTPVSKTIGQLAG